MINLRNARTRSARFSSNYAACLDPTPIAFGGAKMPVRIVTIACVLFLAAANLAAQDSVMLRAGQILNCTLEEPNLSSLTARIGEPVLCYLGPLREFGRSAFPRGSYLAGRVSDYRDPGRLAGKGWLKLDFDRLILPQSEIPIAGKLVAARSYRVDGEGRILGKGHATRDALAWSFPIFWPLQIVRLPARGPKPVLRGEVPLTLRLMDDIEIPCVSYPSCLGASAARRPPR